MPARRFALAVQVLAFLPTIAAPQDKGLQRQIELPAHEALRTVREAQDATLSPFDTDGCSGGLSDAWRLIANTFPAFSDIHEAIPPWEGCCVTHDRAYHTGGADPVPEASYAARLTADIALEACVISEGDSRAETGFYDAEPEDVRWAYNGVARLMYLSVRAGGGPCTGLPWRWGFGYEQCW
ncbi:MAG: hypothetical protein ABJI96_22680 [Paracoccaceae bacterium]